MAPCEAGATHRSARTFTVQACTPLGSKDQVALVRRNANRYLFEITKQLVALLIMRAKGDLHLAPLTWAPHHLHPVRSPSNGCQVENDQDRRARNASRVTSADALRAAPACPLIPGAPAAWLLLPAAGPWCQDRSRRRLVAPGLRSGRRC
jgi:hypothetical protein